MHPHYYYYHTQQQEDISRILDPSYASTSAYSPYSSSKHAQYHDPDYRYFPSTPTHIKPKNKSSRKRNSLEGRPSWELGQGQSPEDTEEWGVYYNEGATQDTTSSYPYPSASSSSSTTTPSSSSPRRRRRENTTTTTTTTYTSASSSLSPSTSSSYTSSSNSSAGPSTPHSLTATLSDSDLPSHHHHKLTKRLLPQHYCSSPCHPEHVHPFSSADDLTEEEELSSVQREDKDKVHESLKKQWHAMSLSVRFGVFRAQRRVKEALKR
ncbi:hypothetical protein Moror_5190 [Moniliophthora roreri MCA 2997]|nr:hypothetical protein Moror_5190 [Moniliophthora roreri MCA 2997]